MRERDYRESRLCRILGNPTAYRILVLLLDGSRRTPTEIAGVMGRARVTVSLTLRLLRNAEFVRYERKGREALYWVKYPSEVRALVASLRGFVTRANRRLQRDT